MSRTSLFIPGQSIGGRFRVEGFLGRGGAGNVLTAVDEVTGKRVALKLLRSKAALDPVLVERFRREAKALDGIDHPGVIGVEDAGALDDGTLFLAMELLDGVTLAQRIGREGPMSAQELAPIVTGLCDALRAIHAHGILHRDIKPSNIFLPNPNVSADVVKLVDFGVVKVQGLEGLTREAISVGTSAYMAPEQLRGRRADLGARVDVYATGVTLYEALSGKRPFMTSQELHVYEAILSGRYPSLIEAAPGVPVAVVKVVERAFAKDAAARYPDAPALSAAFAAAANAD
ncbi:MAG: serine/threonine protein kinase [Deltaproteobacteria bacterium]|nr:serine/threonine protein kinase [Deltaproteobacteria bacterium]